MSFIMSTYGPAKKKFLKGSGASLFDEHGREYVDLLSGIAVTSLGHAHPEISEVIASQAAKLSHTSNFFSNEFSEKVAEGLASAVADGGSPSGKVFFCNSGAEAMEAALKVVRRAKGPSGNIVTALGSFHGRTYGALSATGQQAKQAPFAPLLPGFAHLPYGDLDAMAQYCANNEVAAIALEPIQGEGGVIVAPEAYLEGVAKLAKQVGALLLLDEVQTGIGRTGRWCGFHHDAGSPLAFKPDVVTFAKALGNGMPVGACWASEEVSQVMVPGDHGSTFGGQHLAMAVADKVLSIVERDGLVARAQALGAIFASELSKVDGVAEVRGRGLLLGVALDSARAGEVADEALKAGLVVNAVIADTLRLAPPLILTDAEALDASARLAAVISAVMNNEAA